MRTYLECLSCFVRQALDASRRGSGDPAVQERVLRATLRMAADMPVDLPPPRMGQRIHRLLREETGNPDPYALAKQESNTLVLELYPILKKRVRASGDPFGSALRLAIAGNIIDAACKSALSKDEVARTIETAMEVSLDETCVDALRRAIDGAGEILYLADNAGEIVLDRLLIEEMPGDRVTLAVRGGAGDQRRHPGGCRGCRPLRPGHGRGQRQ